MDMEATLTLHGATNSRVIHPPCWLSRVGTITLCVLVIFMAMWLVVSTPVHAYLYGGGVGAKSIGTGTDANKIIGSSDAANKDIIIDTSGSPTPPPPPVASDMYNLSRTFIPLGFILAVIFSMFWLMSKRVHVIVAIIVSLVIVYLAMPFLEMIVDFFDTVW